MSSADTAAETVVVADVTSGEGSVAETTTVVAETTTAEETTVVAETTTAVEGETENVIVEKTTVEETTTVSTIPAYAVISGLGTTVASFCHCSAPGYVSKAPPFCWSSSAATLIGTYKCTNCSLSAYLGSAFVDPYYMK